MNWNSECGLEWVVKINVMPAKRRSMKHGSSRWINHARHRHTNAFARAHITVSCQDLLDSLGEFLCKQANFFRGLKTADGAKLSSEQIGYQDVSARSANVDTNYTALARVDVKECGSATSSDRFAQCSFKNEPFIKEFAYQQACNTPPNVHEPCEICA